MINETAEASLARECRTVPHGRLSSRVSDGFLIKKSSSRAKFTPERCQKGYYVHDSSLGADRAQHNRQG
jgi:hypothetical protein